MQLTDREAIMELMAIYANALDTKNYHEIAACFIDNATADYSGFSEPLVGIGQIIPHMKRSLDSLSASQHLFTNFIIAMHTDNAELRCDILAQHMRDDQGKTTSFLAGGKYTVTAVKHNGRWRFKSINARSSWNLGDRSMLPSVSSPQG